MKKPVSGKRESRLATKIAFASFCRFLLNTARRFIYPFAPALSRGLKVPLSAITTLIAASESTSIIGIVFGPAADRFGYRLMMLLGLCMLTLGMSAGGLLPIYGVVFAAIVMAGLGKSMFDPAILAYVSERIPFHRRGFVISLVELSWAASTLVGIPLLALLIDKIGLQAPFLFLGAAGAFSLLTLKWLFRTDKIHKSAPARLNFKTAWLPLFNNRAAVGLLIVGFCLASAINNFFVVYGVWLEADFQLSIVSLGLGTMVIGLAEVMAGVAVAVLADRLGLKRSLRGGMLLTIIGYIVLPLAARTLTLALGGVFFLFLVFEFTVVVAISLSTEILPGSRATMVSSFHAATGVGYVTGALMGVPIWNWGGLMSVGLISAMVGLLALAAAVWSLWGWKETPPASSP